MARNALKSNVTWSSYPFLPPTGASGCLAELLGETRWYEGNTLGLYARRVEDLPGYEGVFALGAYPIQWQMSRRHFRSHLNSIFNYEATIWSAGRNKGKKLAIVEEVMAETLVFVVASHDRAKLQVLHKGARGRLAAVAKKGSIQFAYISEPEVMELQLNPATGQEGTLALMSASEMGSLPKRKFLQGQALVHYVPVRSYLTANKRMEWDIMPCVWDEDLRFRPGVPLFAGSGGGGSVGISRQLWDRISGATVVRV
jgi:hypothetical protein